VNEILVWIRDQPGYIDRQAHAAHGKRVVRSAHEGGGKEARTASGGGSSKRIRRQEVQQSLSYMDSDGVEMEAVHKLPPQHRRPPTSCDAPEATVAAASARRGRTSAEELHAIAADSIDAVVALQELIAQSQRDGHVQVRGGTCETYACWGLAVRGTRS
jgi:hypothetical protein